MKVAQDNKKKKMKKQMKEIDKVYKRKDV